MLLGKEFARQAHGFPSRNSEPEGPSPEVSRAAIGAVKIEAVGLRLMHGCRMPQTRDKSEVFREEVRSDFEKKRRREPGVRIEAVLERPVSIVVWRAPKALAKQ